MAATVCSSCKQALSATAKFCPNCGAPQKKATLSFGDYEATEVIGEGGMGRVYKAVQRRLNRTVCIKTLLPQFASDQNVVKRFEKEAMTMAALQHPNIVQVFDVGQTDDGTAYIVMELVDGKPLRHILRDEAPVPVARAIKLVDQVLAGLGEAHTHNIVHRDLKPGNVLVVSLRDGAELCKVLDFGIARVLDDNDNEERLTRTGTMVGTPGYMAPEQMLGEQYDARVDLYAAGVLLYELITGQRLFRAPNETELMKKVLLETPQAPSTRTSQQVPRALDEVVLKALSREAKDRYGSAGDFRDALSAVLRTSSSPGTPVAPELATRAGVEFTSLADLMNPGSVDATSNTRSLLSAVLSAADEWERGRLIEPYERSIRTALVEGDDEGVRGAVMALQREQQEKGLTDNLKALLEVTRHALSDSLAVLHQRLVEPRHAPTAKWLLRLLGRSAIPGHLDALPNLPKEALSEVLQVVHALDPDSSALLAHLKTADPKVIKLVLETVRAWPGDAAYPLFLAMLTSVDANVRRRGLKALDERTAFRMTTAVRQRLHDPVASVRAEALKWIYRLEDDGAVDDLEKLLARATLEPTERQMTWRTLSHLRSERAVGVLMTQLHGARDAEQQGELATLLVRTKNPAAIAHVRGMQDKVVLPKLKRMLEEALREAELSTG